jgi:UDP-glucuronate decarboxylase
MNVVVTGAGGWLGQATLEMLEAALGDGFLARVHAFGSSGRTMHLRSGTQVQVRPLGQLTRSQLVDHLVAHFAFATREQVPAMGVQGFISTNEGISDIVAGHLRAARPRAFTTISSGAVHLGGELEKNPYGVLKARDEHRFLGLGSELGTRVVVPRLFNLTGPFLNKPEHYVLGSILFDIAGGGPIRLKADHPVIRSFVYVGDLVELAFRVLMGNTPLPEEAFDTAGEREVEVGELAALCAQVLGVPDVAISRHEVDQARPDRYVGDPAVMNDLASSLGVDFSDLSEQIARTADFLGV